MNVLRGWGNGGGPYAVSFLILVLHKPFEFWNLVIVILVISVFNKSRKRASATSVNDLGLCFTGMALFSGFISTTGAAAGGTAGQLHQTGGKVDLRVVLLKPGHT